LFLLYLINFTFFAVRNKLNHTIPIEVKKNKKLQLLNLGTSFYSLFLELRCICLVLLTSFIKQTDPKQKMS